MLCVCVQVDQIKLELLKLIGKRWVNIRQERGFDVLKGWAIKDRTSLSPQKLILKISVDDLLSHFNLKTIHRKEQLVVFYDPLRTIHILPKSFNQSIQD